MYYYIYDSFVSDPRFAREIDKIETRLTDLGISGHVARLSLFRNAREMIRDEVRRGLSGGVAVGNDETVGRVIDAVADQGVVFGMIPVGTPNTIARMLGIPYGVAACDALSARRVEKIDVGIVNGHRFITGISSLDFRARIVSDGGWSMEPKESSVLEVSNVGSGDPRDGMLETVIRVGGSRHGMTARRPKSSRLSLRSLKIESKDDVSLLVDGSEMRAKRFEIAVVPLGLQLITGRERMF